MRRTLGADLKPDLTMIRASVPFLLLLGALSTPAAAHPHVYVTGSSELVFGEGHSIAAVRHRWTFDELFSTMATQGLDANGDGTFSRDELSDLAKINVESLSEYAFFTYLKADEALAEFDEPVDYWLDYADGQLTLNFTLPVKDGFYGSGGKAEFSVYDPSFFVAFAFDTGKELSLVNGPAGCTADVTLPQDIDKMQSTTLADAFILEAGSDANFGEEFAGKITVACK